MAYDDTHCPCGGRKETETMLCGACMQAFQDTPDMRTFQDPHAGYTSARPAAIRLIARARKRLKPTPR